VDLPADSVDVNVHPRKMEVRYNKPDAVKKSVRTAIENALREEGILRSSAPRGRSAPEQTPIEPVTPDDEVELTPDHPTRSTRDASSGPASNDIDDRLPDTQSARQFGETESTASQPDTQPPQNTDSSRSTTQPSRTSETNAEDPDSELASSDPETQSPPAAEPEPEQATNEDPSQTASTTDPETQTTLHGDVATPSTEYDDLPNLHVLGQLQNTYIVAETDAGLVLIDQHAADERVNYERLQKQFAGETTAQALAEPVEVELTAREASAFAAARTALSRIGFQTERVDDRTIQVSTVPAVIAEPAGPELVRDVIVDLVDDESDPERMVEEIADELLADMACHPSITGNTSLTEGSVVELLSALDDCDNPWSCPHGRPVVIQIDSDEIDERFERDYPGH
jgi:DNA mismatch repair protein MutL